MVESRWGRRIGPAVAVLGALALVTTTTVGARDRSWDPPPCAAIPHSSAAPPGTWWRLDPRLERRAPDRAAPGARRAGWTRSLDDPAGRSVRRRPVRWAGADRDRRWSTVEALARRPGPWLQPLDRGRDGRRPHGDPDPGPDGHPRDARRPADPCRPRGVPPATRRRPAVRLLGPIARDARFGPTWSTRLVWALDGQALAVESCGAIACRVRVVDPETGRVRLVGAPDQGEIVGLAAGRLIVREACGGMPCAVIAADVATGDRVTLDHEAWRVALAAEAGGRARVVLETGRDGRTLVAMDPDGRRPTGLRPDASGRRLLPDGAASESAVEMPPGAVVLAPDGRLPSGPGAVGLRRLVDDTTVELQEVTR